MHSSVASARRLGAVAAHLNSQPAAASSTCRSTTLTDVQPLLYPMSRGKNLGSPQSWGALPTHNADGLPVAPITDEIRYQFDTRGWVCIPGVIPRARAAEYRSAAKAAHAAGYRWGQAPFHLGEEPNVLSSPVGGILGELCDHPLLGLILSLSLSLPLSFPPSLSLSRARSLCLSRARSLSLSLSLSISLSISLFESFTVCGCGGGGVVGFMHEFLAHPMLSSKTCCKLLLHHHARQQ